MNNDGYILLVEDEPLIQKRNKRILERHGYAIRQAFTLTEARDIIAGEAPRAVILDIGLPDGSGLHFMEELRQVTMAPVLMLTAMGTPEDIIKGLEAGGDDYLAKPYELNVFLARVQTLLRRASMIPESLSLGPFRIDISSGKAYLNNEDMALSQKEYSLLQHFMQNPEKMLTAETIYEKAWGQKMLGDENALKTAISRLRAKLTDSGWTIYASRGEGYCFERE